MNLNFITKTTDSTANDSGFGVNFNDFEISTADIESNPRYACISYAWGDTLIPHPFDKEKEISNRTLSVLHCALLAYQNLLSVGERDLPKVDKFWMDSFCMPSKGIEKEEHIFLLGEIYFRSCFVMVVLQSEFSTVLEKVKDKKPFTAEDFKIINGDDWVSRYWTYQEIVKSPKVYLIAESSETPAIHASDLFIKLSQEFEMFCFYQRLKTTESIKKYQSLSALEAVILDEKTQETRSIYQVMVNMEYRKSNNEYSKLQSIYSCLADYKELDVVHLNDDLSKFYELCKRNNDYSFIFNTSRLREPNHQKWKPISYDFKPIYNWLYCWAPRQYGELHNDHLLLKDLIIIESKANISIEVEPYLYNILNDNVRCESSNILDIIKINLTELNFEGCLDPIELARGFYFDQFDTNFTENNVIAISSTVQWPFGAPAMKLTKRESGDIYDFISAGVFFGNMGEKNLLLTTIKID